MSETFLTKMRRLMREAKYAEAVDLLRSEAPSEGSDPWAGSGNYTADHPIFPTKIRFANGRVVQVAPDGKWLLVDQVE